MLLYLSSQKFGNNINLLKEWLKTHSNNILLIFNALDAKGKEKIDCNIKEDTTLLEKIGFNVKVINLQDYFGKSEKLENEFIKYNSFCVMGGNVFVLRKAMEYSGFDEFLNKVSSNPNYLYIGYSAGSSILSKNLKILDTVDEPINFYNNNDKVSYEGIGLIDYVIVPHYKSNYHKVNLINDIVNKCKNENIKFKAIKDGEVIIENLSESKIDETIRTYDNIVNEYIEYFKSKDLKGNVQFQREIDVLVNTLQNGSKILDVGTAIGDYPKYLTEKCNKDFEVIGIDSSKNMINVAIDNAPKANFEVMDMRTLKFPPNSFDAILCFATLIHVNDEEALKIMENFNTILKKKGLIIINVMEHINGEKEIYDKEPFNPEYNTYFNRYTKDFFVNWFLSKKYKILATFDNPIFNAGQIKEPSIDTNQFSIIVQKI